MLNQFSELISFSTYVNCSHFSISWCWLWCLLCQIDGTLSSSVIIQKGKSQNGGNKKRKHATFSAKTNISYSLIRNRTCAYQGVRNVRLFEKFGVLCFLVTSVVRFAFLPYYQLNVVCICLNPYQAHVTLYRNQSIDFQFKSIDWFPWEYLRV